MASQLRQHPRHEQPQHLRTPGTKRRSDADLRRPLNHSVCGDAVESHRREQERDRRHNRQGPTHRTRNPSRLLRDSLERQRGRTTRRRGQSHGPRPGGWLASSRPGRPRTRTAAVDGDCSAIGTYTAGPAGPFWFCRTVFAIPTIVSHGPGDCVVPMSDNRMRRPMASVPAKYCDTNRSLTMAAELSGIGVARGERSAPQHRQAEYLEIAVADAHRRHHATAVRTGTHRCRERPPARRAPPNGIELTTAAAWMSAFASSRS